MRPLYKRALTALVPGLSALLAWTIMPPPPEVPAPPIAEAPPQPAAPPTQGAPSPSPAAPRLGSQLLIAPAPGAELEAIAADCDCRVIRPVGVSGYGVLELPPGRSEQELTEALRADPRTLSLSRHGRTRAPDHRGGEAAPGSWQLAALGLPRDLMGGEVVLALADTGVSLGGIDTTAPWDFVDDDGDASDESGHGTRLAALIAGPGGAAPGISLMPLRVLDERGLGLEYDLIEATWWAIDSGADILVFGLYLGPDYTPSAPLLEALDAARDAGLVVLGAAGDDGELGIRWPAASPAVLAVGAACPEGGGLGLAPYSSRGPGLALVAPGDCLDRDEGSDRAAALAAAAAGHLLAEGVRPEDVPVLLRHTARPLLGGDGSSPGVPDVSAALALAETLPPEGYAPRDAYHVAILPFLRGGGGLVTPSARLVTLDATLAPARDVVVSGSLRSGDRVRAFTCRPAADGVCVISGLPVPAGSAQAWAIQVDQVLLGGTVAFAPSGLAFATDALERATREARSEALLAAAVPALRWSSADTSILGPIAPAYAVVDMAVGAAAPVTGLLMTPPLLREEGAEPAGIRGASLLHLRAHPRGELLVFDAEGAIFSPSVRRRARCSSCRFDGQPILLSQGRIAGVEDAAGSAIQAALDEGGWLLDFRGGATALLAILSGEP